jgi:thermitase
MRTHLDSHTIRSALLCVVTAGLLLSAAGATDASAASDPLRSAQWALDAIHLGADKGPASGAGALVAVIDSGVDATHPDLAGRVVPGPDLVDHDGDPSDPTGHGTHIAGIIAAAAGNGIGIAGVAPAARILAVRVLETDGTGTAANVAAGIDAAVDAGADVINLSLNWSQAGQALAPVTAAMQRAADAGALVIVAAGNDARARCQEPVLPHAALCVGALSSNLERSPFSSYGQGLGLVAPGDDLVSTWNDDTYQRSSGTSQAAAVTSGVAALLVELGYRGAQIMQRLLASARDIASPGRDAATGAGMLDAERAVDGATEHRIAAVLQATTATEVTTATVRRRGLRVACDAARPGRCRVTIRVAGRIIATGSAAVDGTGAFGISARPSAAGLRALAGARTLRATVKTSLAGAASVRHAISLRAR